MLRITVDSFSGRPNPSWILTGSEAQELLTEVSRNQDAITDIATGYSGLGFRGIILEPLSDEITSDFGIANLNHLRKIPIIPGLKSEPSSHCRFTAWEYRRGFQPP